MSPKKPRENLPLSTTGLPPSSQEASTPDPSRRRFLQSTAMVAAASVAPLSANVLAQPSPNAATASTAAPTALGDVASPLADVASPMGGVASMSLAGNATQPVRLTLNGRPFELHLEARVTLLDAIREYAGLTGTKKGCDRGQCGACTVIANGRRINACLSLAVMHAGEAITTVEGLATDHIPSAVQQAFIEHDAFQCGFCTPGQLCSATALIEEFRAGDASAATGDVRQGAPQLSDAEIRERMSGNICRCGAYPNIVSAIKTIAVQKA
jgi:xanthine dehydrogenase YagT iron-sulfur-binding subunit